MLLRGEWEQAAAAILAEQRGERGSAAAARQLWLHGGDAATAAAAMPRHMVAERAILQVRHRPSSTRASCTGAQLCVWRSLTPRAASVMTFS